MAKPHSLSEFQKGVRAFFDALSFRAANNWHGNPAIDEKCQAENRLVMRWAEEALEEVDESSFNEWRKTVNLLSMSDEKILYVLKAHRIPIWLLPKRYKVRLVAAIRELLKGET